MPIGLHVCMCVTISAKNVVVELVRKTAAELL